MSKKIKKKMSPCVPLRFPSFEKFYQYQIKERGGETIAYNFEPVDCREWYQKFADRVIEAVDNKSYLPLYRMGDGEYIFALEEDPGTEGAAWELSVRDVARKVVEYIRGEAQRGSGGIYSPRERSRLQREFVDGIRMVSNNGVLALALHESKFYQNYISHILEWMENNNIKLNRNNYIHFYSTYVLLNGPDSKRLLEGRNIAVATWIDEDRKSKIKKGLEERGVKNVHFLPTSKRKSMLDDIDEGHLNKDVDLVLIAAGIGAINIIRQLKFLEVPQIDIGFCMDVIANPKLRWERPFCVPDEEFNFDKINY